MTQPIISIITTNLNSGTRLTATCESVASQSAGCEHLIMDGLSRDGSRELAEQLAAKYPHIRVLAEKDRHIFDAMNKGVHAAKGRYIYFLGAGDLVLPGILPKVIAELPEHDLGFIYGDVDMSGKIYDGEFTWRKLCVGNICHQAIFYGRDIYQLCGEYDFRYKGYADWEYNFRCFGRREINKKYIPLVIANYEPGGNSVAGDPLFEKEKRSLIIRHLGLRRYARVRLGRMAGLALQWGKQLGGRAAN